MSTYNSEEYDPAYGTLWDHDFYSVLEDTRESDYDDRWLEAWDRLEALGVVSSPADDNITLRELERIAGYVKS